jgi:hypothetical protein
MPHISPTTHYKKKRYSKFHFHFSLSPALDSRFLGSLKAEFIALLSSQEK